jgi:hypothetical protein
VVADDGGVFVEFASPLGDEGVLCGACCFLLGGGEGGVAGDFGLELGVDEGLEGGSGDVVGVGDFGDVRGEVCIEGDAFWDVCWGLDVVAFRSLGDAGEGPEAGDVFGGGVGFWVGGAVGAEVEVGFGEVSYVFEGGEGGGEGGEVVAKGGVPVFSECSVRVEEGWGCGCWGGSGCGGSAAGWWGFEDGFGAEDLEWCAVFHGGRWGCG